MRRCDAGEAFAQLGWGFEQTLCSKVFAAGHTDRMRDMPGYRINGLLFPAKALLTARIDQGVFGALQMLQHLLYLPKTG